MVAGIAMLVTIGCGSGGGSSPNPVTPVTPGTAINSILPAAAGPNAQITITGYGFGERDSSRFVTYNGGNVEIVSWRPTEIVVRMPATTVANGTFAVVIGGTVISNPTTITQPEPRIYSVSPTSAGPGDEVTITGEYLGERAGASWQSFTVTFGGQTAVVTTWTDRTIVCTVPTLTTTTTQQVSVVVNNGRTSNAYPYSVATPVVTGVTPNQDNVGAQVTVTGQRFGTIPGQVTIGGAVANVVSWSDTSILVRVPAPTDLSPGSKAVVVTVNGRPSSPLYAFSVAAPMVTAQSPYPARKDAELTLTGAHFGTSATEGPGTLQLQGDSSNLLSPRITFWSDTQIRFICPIGGYIFPSEQSRDVTITVGGISSTWSILIE